MDIHDARIRFTGCCKQHTTWDERTIVCVASDSNHGPARLHVIQHGIISRRSFTTIGLHNIDTTSKKPQDGKVHILPRMQATQPLKKQGWRNGRGPHRASAANNRVDVPGIPPIGIYCTNLWPRGQAGAHISRECCRARMAAEMVAACKISGVTLSYSSSEFASDCPSELKASW